MWTSLHPPNPSSGREHLAVRFVCFYADNCITDSCSDLQILAIHDYNIDPTYVASNIDAAKPSALASGQRLLYEEFGAMGSDKQSQIEAVTTTLLKVKGTPTHLNRCAERSLDWCSLAVLGGYEAWRR